MNAFILSIIIFMHAGPGQEAEAVRIPIVETYSTLDQCVEGLEEIKYSIMDYGPIYAELTCNQIDAF